MKISKTALALALCVSASTAQSALLTYDFSVTATSGSLSGTSASGSFSFDDVAVPPGVSATGTELLTSLDFNWNGIHYDSSTANTGAIIRELDGDLDIALFGTNCFTGVCGVSSSVEGWAFRGGVGGLNDFSYSDGLAIGGGTSSTTLRVTQVPEPASIALLALGLAGLGISRRKLT